jgi:hypothetical protein
LFSCIPFEPHSIPNATRSTDSNPFSDLLSQLISMANTNTPTYQVTTGGSMSSYGPVTGNGTAVVYHPDGSAHQFSGPVPAFTVRSNASAVQSSAKQLAARPATAPLTAKPTVNKPEESPAKPVVLAIPRLSSSGRGSGSGSAGPAARIGATAAAVQPTTRPVVKIQTAAANSAVLLPKNSAAGGAAGAEKPLAVDPTSLVLELAARGVFCEVVPVSVYQCDIILEDDLETRTAVNAKPLLYANIAGVRIVWAPVKSIEEPMATEPTGASKGEAGPAAAAAAAEAAAAAAPAIHDNQMVDDEDNASLVAAAPSVTYNGGTHDLRAPPGTKSVTGAIELMGGAQLRIPDQQAKPMSPEEVKKATDDFLAIMLSTPPGKNVTVTYGATTRLVGAIHARDGSLIVGGAPPSQPTNTSVLTTATAAST